MTATRRFRRQHRELQKLAALLLKEAHRPGSDATTIQRALRRFVGKLRIHATMETGALYPALLASDDDAVRERAERLHRELDPLYSLVDGLLEVWGTAEKIDARRIRFRIELTRVIAKLGWRMMRENRELYPMADQALG